MLKKKGAVHKNTAPYYNPTTYIPRIGQRKT